jgi:hypothetical protein
MPLCGPRSSVRLAGRSARPTLTSPHFLAPGSKSLLTLFGGEKPHFVLEVLEQAASVALAAWAISLVVTRPIPHCCIRLKAAPRMRWRAGVGMIASCACYEPLDSRVRTHYH